MRTSNRNKLVDSTKEKYERPQIKTVQVKMENGIAADSATTKPNNSVSTEWQQMPEASADLDW
ncbi:MULTISPECIES: hypothetical protein [Sphingobacterium]|uniref:Uncharacterized protein n=1 Tax=Sphingobacterium ginsenosidimutans TaxID=687845 RepID=A0ABP8A7U8_9SPHI|nr:hypothetical protein [Sphingobacterium sp. E70]ULT25412.1 hypothetical protein KUH03_42690 [Sphingobacterium sp. E70]